MHEYVNPTTFPVNDTDNTFSDGLESWEVPDLSLTGEQFAHRMNTPLHQHSLDPTIVRARHVVGHPVTAEQVPRDFNHDVVGIEVRVFVVAFEAL